MRTAIEQAGSPRVVCCSCCKEALRITAEATTDHPIAIGRGFRCDPQRFPLQQEQQTALGSGLLDRGAHQRPDQLFQNDFA